MNARGLAVLGSVQTKGRFQREGKSTRSRSALTGSVSQTCAQIMRFPTLHKWWYLGPLTEVIAVSGERALLPCDVRPAIAGDTTIIVLFYHGAVGTPVYSLDARDGTLYDHWRDENTLGSRAKFELNLDPPGLVIDPVLPADENLYRCRVDFKSTPTRNSRVRLTVIEPPERVLILNEQGLEASGVIGPYAVGERVRLRCEVLGGRPRPTVSWWHEDTLLDSTSEQQGTDVTSNVLLLPPLKRSDLYKILTCQGSNNNLTIPEASTVTIDVIFPPYNVELSGLDDPLIEGSHYEVECEARGSRPPAILSWWKNDVQLQPINDQILVENNVSRSRLRLEARVDDQGATLTCRAENPQIPDSLVHDSIPLEVHFSPRLHLAAGVSLNMNNIREGADAYFECNIHANPKVFRVQWTHNGVELHHNVSAGIILSNQSLVLQKVSRSSSGHYVCSTSNVLGEGTSEPLLLNVKYAPVCLESQQAVYGGGKNEHLNVSCAVHAHPSPSVFRWAFNSSSEINDIEHKRYSVVGDGVSQVWYTPRSHLDYGSLLCWATNDVGTQLEPCVFHIIHASNPEPVHNCSVSDVGRSSASVRCHAGWDGGLPQTFTLSVSQGERSATSSTNSSRKGDPRVLANTSSSPKPEFAVTGLESSTQYVLTITAVNSRGQSIPVSLAIKTSEDKALKHTSPGENVRGSDVHDHKNLLYF
ncbi:CD80-like immunoglobulin C2-set [Trinorchestia longiramus]|nr:CD80-like immunoglobulin C2-set [Trinorchestia longiramus]